MIRPWQPARRRHAGIGNTTGEEVRMHRQILSSSFVVALVALTAVATAAGARARSDQGATAGSGFVGTWRVLVTQADGISFPVLSSYHADGTTLHAGPISQPAAPGSPAEVLLQTAGHGVWESTDAETSSITFEVLTGDERGNFLGRLTISGTQTLDPGGDSFTGRYVITVSDPAGSVVATVPTTATGERMRVALPASLGAAEAASPAS
jgi:hypothetical protein